MPIVSKLIAKLQRHPKRIVFPEGHDPRILQAARQWVMHRLGAPILLGDRTLVKNAAQRLDINLQGIRIIDPARSEDYDTFVQQYLQLRPGKNTPEQARADVANTNYYATLMLLNAQADGLVSGATTTASSALRPLFQLIPKRPHSQHVSSLMVLDYDEKQVGSNGTLFLADCGVIPNPTAEQLCDIALSTANIARHLTNETPRVAMLSYSSKSPTTHSDPSVEKVRQATQLAREKAAALKIQIEIDGELQADAALDPYIASTKKIAPPVAGCANVLVFPDLNSANIAFKLAHHLAGGNAYGQILTGLSKPAAEISRGASAHDIFGAATIVGCQAVDRHLLFPQDPS